MIMQRSLSHRVTDCPICGRPVRVDSRYISHEIACGHCRGQFVVYETDTGLAARKLLGWDSLERAEQLLRCSQSLSHSASSGNCRRLLDLLTVLDDEGAGGDCRARPFGTDVEEAEAQPMALLVEDRDEVFARIATDVAESGMRVVRAKSATEALKLCGRYEPALVVANVDLPEQNGWMLASKLRFVDQKIQVWLYQPKSTSYSKGMADYLRVDELLEYGGDLLGLSETILELMTNRRRLHAAGSAPGTTGEVTAE